MITKNIPDKSESKSHSIYFLVFFGALCLFFFFSFMSLGIWQVERLGWKTNLIAQVNERTHLAPVPALLKDQWANITKDKDEYRPVQIRGTYLNDKEILVTAVAQETTGYWLMTPLQADDGSIIFINRGFVPMSKYDKATRENGNIVGSTTVTGLLRMSESNGFFPRKNDPENNSWYSRELPAMAQKIGLQNVAPYFIDADKTPNIGGTPIGGLTIISFPNNHLSYLITWFVLAAGTLGAGIFLIVSEIRRRKGKTFD